MEINAKQQQHRAATRRTGRLRSLGDESGVAIIEFALILPFFLFLVVAILDFGRAMNYWIDTTHLASEGARFAAVDRIPGDPPASSLQAYIREQADTEELKNGGSDSVPSPLEVCVTNPDGDEVGDPVEVQVRTTYRWIPLLGIDAVSTTITGKATMRREQAASNVVAGCE